MRFRHPSLHSVSNPFNHWPVSKTRPSGTARRLQILRDQFDSRLESIAFDTYKVGADSMSASSLCSLPRSVEFSCSLLIEKTLCYCYWNLLNDVALSANCTLHKAKKPELSSRVVNDTATQNVNAAYYIADLEEVAKTRRQLRSHARSCKKSEHWLIAINYAITKLNLHVLTFHLLAKFGPSTKISKKKQPSCNK